MECSVKCLLILYADDTALMVPGRDLGVIEQTLNAELTELNKWLVDNKLSIHPGKTEVIIFGSQRRLKNANQLKILCNGQSIKCKESVSYLGASLDNNCSGVGFAQSVIEKCNSRLKFLYRQCNFLSTKAKKTLASALVLCHFDYASSSWYFSLPLLYKKKLQVCQNKIVRFISGFKNRDHVGPDELSELGLLNTEYRTHQLTLTMVHKIFYNTGPEYLTNNFVKLDNRSNYNTRSKKFNFFVPHVTGATAKTFFYNGLKLWNSLPPDLKSIENLDSFKRKVKFYLNSEMFRKEADTFYYY